MSNLNYIKGRKAEYRAKKILEKEGYLVIRSAGSKGIDLVAFLIKGCDKPLVRAISIKATKYIDKQALKEIKDLSLPLLVSRELWHFKPYKKNPIIL